MVLVVLVVLIVIFKWSFLMKSKFLSALVTSTLVLANAVYAADSAPAAKPGAPSQAATTSAPAAAAAASASTAATPAAAPAAAPAADPVVKKATASGICHDKTSPSFKQTKNFTPFNSMDECLKSGGKPLKK